MEGEELHYSVLVYDEESSGTWVKIPEFELQCLSDNLEIGLEILEEQLFYRLKMRELSGERIPERLVRTIRYVDKDEYGPTAAELAEEEYFDEEWEDEEAGDNRPPDA